MPSFNFMWKKTDGRKQQIGYQERKKNLNEQKKNTSNKFDSMGAFFYYFFFCLDKLLALSFLRLFDS